MRAQAAPPSPSSQEPKKKKIVHALDSWAVRLTPAAMADAPMTAAVMAYTSEPVPALGSLAEPATYVFGSTAKMLDWPAESSAV